MIRLSVADGESLAAFHPVEVSYLEDLLAVVTTSNWSGGLFKDGHRTKANFLEGSLIALDVDDGCSLEKALELFQPYQHIIATTKSHQKEKNGVICDRFRVILFLEHPICDGAIWEATWFKLRESFPFIDIQCKDPSRFYYPSPQVISSTSAGLKVQVATEVAKPLVPMAAISLATGGQTKLARSTMEFLIRGAEPGFWNRSLFKSAKDWQEQGLNQEEFIRRAEMITGELDNKDLSTIQSAFNTNPLYPPRIIEFLGQAEMQDICVKASDLFNLAMDYLSDKDLVKGEPTGIEAIDALLGGGKRLGELTVTHAEAKTGKNTLWHYQQILWAKKGLAQGYASRELNPQQEVIPDYLSILTGKNARLEELNPDLEALYREELNQIPIFFTKGYGLFEIDQMVDWVRYLKGLGVLYFWFDHLHYMLEDPEDHKAAAKLIRNLKTLALEEKVHIDLIIQPNKLMEGQRLSLNSIKGGSAMGQAIDNLVVLERLPEQENTLKVSLKACRSKLGRLGSTYLLYDPNTMTFSEGELERASDPDARDAGEFLETFRLKVIE